MKNSRDFQLFNRYKYLFVGILTKCGCRVRAEKIFFRLIEYLSNEKKMNPIKVFKVIIRRVSPLMCVLPKVKSGITIKIPSAVLLGKEEKIAVKWIVHSARLRSEKGMENKLKAEVLSILDGKSNSIKMRKELHKTVLASRPYMKYM